MRNVVDELPREQHAQVLNVMRAAWKLSDEDEGMKRLEGLARFLEHEYESAARSLREGMAGDVHDPEIETTAFAVQVPGNYQRHREPQSGVQKRTGNVTRWRDAAMVERWVASAWLLTEKHFRKVIGYEHLWTLAVNLGREEHQRATEKVA
jgi:hypothetical protein